MTILIPAWVNDQLQPMEKLEVHRQGLRHLAVSVFAMHGDDVLMQKRALSKYHTPGLWTNTCCTHPAWDEDPRDCAIRRLDEELGLRAMQPNWRQRTEYRADVGNGLIEHELVDIFLVELQQKPQFQCNPEEVMETSWVNIKNLREDVAQNPQIYTPWLKIYLDKHAPEIFGGRL